MRNEKTFVYFVLGALFLIGCADLTAETEDSDQEVIAIFEGKEVNLAESWGEATACLVWTAQGIAECFRTDDQLEQRESELRDMLVTTNPKNSYETNTGQQYGFFNLFQDNDFNVNNPGRRRLHLNDEHCRNLIKFGLEGKVSSVLNLAATPAQIFSQKKCQGGRLQFEPGDFSLNLATEPLGNNRTWDNAALSYRSLPQ